MRPRRSLFVIVLEEEEEEELMERTYREVDMVVSKNKAKEESRSESAARRMEGRRKQMQAP